MAERPCPVIQKLGVYSENCDNDYSQRLLLLDRSARWMPLTRIEMQQLIGTPLAATRFSRCCWSPTTSAEAVAIADRVILIEDGEVGIEPPYQLPPPAEIAWFASTGGAGNRSAPTVLCPCPANRRRQGLFTLAFDVVTANLKLQATGRSAALLLAA
jgi:hypothetical protein